MCYFILQLQIDIFHLLHKFRLKNLATFYGELFQNVGVHFSLQFQSKQTAVVGYNLNDESNTSQTNWNSFFFHIRTMHLDIIKVLFLHQLMH